MSNRRSKQYFESLEKLLSASLEEVREGLSKQDYMDIKEYIDHGEYGVGWELLWHLVHKQRLQVSSGLVECGHKMGFDTSVPDNHL